MYETIRIVEKLKPKYVIWENVKNILSSKHRHNYNNYIRELENLGYRNYAQVLNAKHYGIPQNRERIFTISIRKDVDTGFQFPQKQELKLKLKDIKLGLISNADCIDCKYWNQSPLFRYFNDSIFSCNVGLLKPDRQIYNLAMQRLDVSPDQCLYVGDGGSNELYGAKSAGMGTVFSEMLETKNAAQRESIIKYSDYHIKHINELFNYL